VVGRCVRGFRGGKRCDQAVRVDGVGERLEQLKRAQAPAEQLQALPIRGENT
jgi:hypothetical protein